MVSEHLRAIIQMLRARPDAKIFCGGRPGVTGEALRAALLADRARGCMAECAAAAGDAEVAADVLPAAEMAPIGRSGDAAQAWMPVSVLPPVLRDHLAGGMGQSPRWWWPIRHQQQVIGGLVISGDPVLDADESFVALSAARGLWLSSAEARAARQSINEELADTAKAKSIYQEIVDNPDYQGTIYVSQAQKRLETIEEYSGEVYFAKAAPPAPAKSDQVDMKLPPEITEALVGPPIPTTYDINEILR